MFETIVAPFVHWIRDHLKGAKDRKAEALVIDGQLKQKHLERRKLQHQHIQALEDFGHSEYWQDRTRRQELLRQQKYELEINQAEIDRLDKIKVEKKL